MSRTFGKYGPAHPWLGSLASGLNLVNRPFCAARQFYTPQSRYARERAWSMKEKLRRGDAIYLCGIGPGGHNSGIALVEVTAERGVRLLVNNEQERFSGIKHDTNYPDLAIDSLLDQMRDMDITPSKIHACLASWDYVRLPATFTRTCFEELPWSLTYFNPAANPAILNIGHVWRSYGAPRRLGSQMNLDRAFPIVGMRHHDNHAWFSYAMSPFAGSSDPVMVAVLDGLGDDGSISLYSAKNGKIDMLRSNKSTFDSPGVFYGMVSSTQGGWTLLSSEGRYMGAAAWGQADRLTNPFYRQLRELFHFGNDGQVYLNRALANWHRGLQLRPYTRALSKIIGKPIPESKMWNPDAVLRPDDIRHAEITQERLDKAAATQLVFEDVMFHVIAYLIRTTGSHKLVLTGGTALNAVANMRLLDHFNEEFYERYLAMKQTRLHLWVPPTPGDAGVTAGAAYNFALANGAPLGEPMKHAFYCGPMPTSRSIADALQSTSEIEWTSLGAVSLPHQCEAIADLLAYIISHDGVMGLYQGKAETGPRALGHRSILANPCNPRTRDVLNELVKHREAVRPLAPMATLEAAARFFELSPGASDDDYNAYNYMVLTACARPESHSTIPAVIHKDGTGRVQIVRPETDPFTFAYLKAMGRRAGVEVSVNTSLNVGSPIVQTPKQALETLKRSKGMDGLLMIGADGEAFLAWHNVLAPPKDPRRLNRWRASWQEETTAAQTHKGTRH